MARKDRYQAALAEYYPTMQRVCAENDVPPQVCFAQFMVESGGGKGVLGKKHNYFGLKYPRGKSWKKQWEWLGQPGKVIKFTNEKIKIKSRKHMDRLLKKKAVFKDYVWAANPTFPSRQSLRLPQAFCTFETMEAGILGWCRFMSRSRYKDGGVLGHDPVRWIAYRWMRGYATATAYVEAVVNRMNRVYKYTDDESFLCKIDDPLDDLLDEARLVDGRARWDLAKDALEDNGFQHVPFEVYDFSDEPMIVEVDA